MRRSVIYGLLAGLLAVVLLVAGGLSWFIGQNPKRLVAIEYGGSPAAAMFLPRQSPLVLSLLVNPDQLQAFQETVSHDRQRTQAEWMRLKQGLVAGVDLDYEQDVQPWLGKELTVAVTTIDRDRDPSNGQQPGYLLVAAIAQGAEIQEFLELFWQKQAVAGATLAFEQYKGVQIVSAQPNSSPVPVSSPPSIFQASSLRPSPLRPALANIATAQVGGKFLLVANHPDVLRQAINAAQATDVALLASRNYHAALQALTGDRIGIAIIRGTELAGWAGISGLKLPPVTLSIGLEKQGLRVETIAAPEANTPTSTPALPSLDAPVSALRYLPRSSVLAVASTNLQQLWVDWIAPLHHPSATDPSPSTSLVGDWIATLQQQWQVELAQDIAPWITGDYGLAAVRRSLGSSQILDPANPNGNPSQAQPMEHQHAKLGLSMLDWIAVVKRSPQITTALERLDRIARQQGLSLGTVQLGEQAVSTWTALATSSFPTSKVPSPLVLQVDVKAAHTTVDDYELFATSLEALAQALQASTETSLEASLLASDRFTTAIAPLPVPNSGYLYLDWAATDDLLTQQFPILKFIKFAGSVLFSHLQTVAISSYQDPKVSGVPHPRKGEFFIQLGD